MKRSLYIPFIILLLGGMTACKTGEREVKQETRNTGTSTISDTITELNKMIDQYPDSGDLFNKRAEYYINRNQINKAFRDVNRAMELGGEKAAYYVSLGDIYLKMGNTERSRNMYDKAAQLNDSIPGSFLGMARLHIVLEEYKQAFNILDRLLDFNKHPRAYFLKAIAYEEQQDTTKAIQNLQLALAQDKAFFDAYKELGILLAAQNNSQAARYFKKAINLRPGSPDLHYLLGLHYQNMGMLEQANLHYDTIIMRDPQYKYAHYNKGFIKLIYEEDFEKSIEDFSRAIKADPEYANAYYNRGYAYELLGKLDRAEKNYRKAMELEPNHSKAVMGLNRLDDKRVK